MRQQGPRSSDESFDQAERAFAAPRFRVLYEAWRERGDAVLNERSGASEDISFFLNEVPGTYFVLGIVPRDQDLAKAAPNHSPNCFVDEKALVVGVRALAMVTVNYLAAAKTD